MAVDGDKTSEPLAQVEDAPRPPRPLGPRVRHDEETLVSFLMKVSRKRFWICQRLIFPGQLHGKRLEHGEVGLPDAPLD